MRALIHGSDRHGGTGTQRSGDLQQHREPAHHRLQETARRVPGPDLRPRAPRRRAGLRPGHHPARRRRHRRRRQDRRHAAPDEPGHAVADRQRSRHRDPRRRLLQDPDARRHLRLYPRRLVQDGRAGPRRHRAGQSGAADDHDPAEFLADHHQRAGPGHRDAARLDHADPGRPDRPDALHQQGRPAIRSATTCSRTRRPPARRRTASPTPTASATCSRPTSNRPTSRWSRKFPT